MEKNERGRRRTEFKKEGEFDVTAINTLSVSGAEDKTSSSSSVNE